MTQLATLPNAAEMVAEYEAKRAELPGAVDALGKAMSAIKAAATVQGAHGRRTMIRTEPNVHLSDLEAHLLSSAWWAAWHRCQMDVLATASDKARAEADLQNPPAFTVENIADAFGGYLLSPREHVLRGLAEAFCALDDAYKSHSKVKIGVKGLPKRVVVHVGSRWSSGDRGWNRVRDMLNALSVFNGEGLVPHDMLLDIRDGRETWRGLTFKRFGNGNWHIHFDKDACRQINLALAEYYGEALPDVEPEKEDLKADPGARALAKDLQYYPTPDAIADEVLKWWSMGDGARVLEPSCGCGRLMEAVRRAATRQRVRVEMEGIETDMGRADEARAKGHRVTVANFLEVDPAHVEPCSHVVMNPPFYGRHYLKHIRHAMRFLKPGGSLVSILPATAHYDHKALPDGYRWRDLPVGAFAESGTRIPTGLAIWERVS